MVQVLSRRERPRSRACDSPSHVDSFRAISPRAATVSHAKLIWKAEEDPRDGTEMSWLGRHARRLQIMPERAAASFLAFGQGHMLAGPGRLYGEPRSACLQPGTMRGVRPSGSGIHVLIVACTEEAGSLACVSSTRAAPVGVICSYDCRLLRSARVWLFATHSGVCGPVADGRAYVMKG